MTPGRRWGAPTDASAVMAAHQLLRLSPLRPRFTFAPHQRRAAINTAGWATYVPGRV